MVGIAIAAAGAMSATSSLAGGLISSSGAKAAGSEEAQAEEYAAQLEESQYEQTRTDLQPYNIVGQAELPSLASLSGQTQNALQGAYNQAQSAIPGQMSQSWLEQQPGYQFLKAQGQAANQSAAASRGLGVSGAALKAASTYATGLANTYYNTAFSQAQTQYSDYNQQYSNLYNMYNQLYNQESGIANLGENAAAKSGAIGQSGAAAAGSSISSAGQAQAAGTSTSANDIANTTSSLGNLPMQYMAMNKLFGSSSGSTTAGSDATTTVSNPNVQGGSYQTSTTGDNFYTGT